MTPEERKKRRNEQARARNAADPEKRRAVSKRYMEKYRDADPEKYREKRKAANKKWKDANPEKDRASKKKWNDTNQEKVRELTKKWNEANPERVRANRRRSEAKRRVRCPDTCRSIKLRVMYGITLDDYKVMLESQGGFCAMCGELAPEGKCLHIDHDHTTGAVRALLCGPCNLGIGHLRDDPHLCRLAANYLEASL